MAEPVGLPERSEAEPSVAERERERVEVANALGTRWVAFLQMFLAGEGSDDSWQNFGFVGGGSSCDALDLYEFRFHWVKPNGRRCGMARVKTITLNIRLVSQVSS